MKRSITLVVAAAFVGSVALADSAANAYVTVAAPGAKTAGGVDFATSASGDSVMVEVKANPGWVLTSPSTLVIPKGQAGAWSARSFYGESDSGGEICIPQTTTTSNHVKPPRGEVKLQVNHGNNNPGASAGAGAGHGDKDRGGVINIGASLFKDSAGLHRVVTAHDSCPGGKSNKHTEESGDEAVLPDTFAWTWSVGDVSGSSREETLLVSGVVLPRGKYTVTVTLSASSSTCPSCKLSATATREINIGNGVIAGVD